PPIDAGRCFLRAHGSWCSCGGPRRHVGGWQTNEVESVQTFERQDTAMTSTTRDMPSTPNRTVDRREIPTGSSCLIKDSWTEATRHLRAIPRNPELLMFATIQPI